MTTQTLHKLTKRAEKLLALENLILASERDWYQAELQSILVKLEAFVAEVRNQYGVRIADIMQMSTVPSDMLALAKLMAQIKRQLQDDAERAHLNHTHRTPASRYRFFPART